MLIPNNNFLNRTKVNKDYLLYDGSHYVNIVLWLGEERLSIFRGEIIGGRTEMFL